MKPLVIIALVSILFAGPRDALAAQQEGTPIVPSNGCTVAPMPEDRIDELAAMAAASPDAGLPTQAVTLPDGTSITADVQAQLLDTLFQINACSWANDLPRLLSLYSERFIVAQFFAPETVPIVPAPDRTPTDATPAPMPTDQQPMIFAAVQLPDGRIAALVSPNSWGGDQQIVWFARQDGRWVVDQTTPASDAEFGGVTGIDIHTEAQPMVDLVLQDAATQLGVDPSALTVTDIETVDWPDSSLGCPEDGGVYAQVVSPGYRITVTDGATTLEYHTGLNDAFVLCAS
jgi:hypothetical protein